MVDLKGDSGVDGGRPKLGALTCEEQNLIAYHRVVDRENGRQHHPLHQGHSADTLLAEQPSALSFGEHFHLVEVHHHGPPFGARRPEGPVADEYECRGPGGPESNGTSVPDQPGSSRSGSRREATS